MKTLVASNEFWFYDLPGGSVKEIKRGKGIISDSRVGSDGWFGIQGLDSEIELLCFIFFFGFG